MPQKNLVEILKQLGRIRNSIDDRNCNLIRRISNGSNDANRIIRRQQELYNTEKNVFQRWDDIFKMVDSPENFKKRYAKFMRECTSFGDFNKCQQDWMDRGRYDITLPTEEEVSLDPILYSDHPAPIVKEWVHKYTVGD